MEEPVHTNEGCVSCEICNILVLNVVVFNRHTWMEYIMEPDPAHGHFHKQEQMSHKSEAFAKAALVPHFQALSGQTGR